MSPEIRAGQAIYTDYVLSLLYDRIVLRISNTHIWKCPTPIILDHYNRHVSRRHLDVGVGTGYYLDNCTYPPGDTELVLMDINGACLNYAKKRVARLRPETVSANVLEPIIYHGERFGSIAVTYLLHCLPGNIAGKAAIFDHLIPLLKPDGVIFGATIVNGTGETSWIARTLMKAYNRQRIFCNEQDTQEMIKAELQTRFSVVNTEMVGCVMLFSARL